MAKRKLTDQEIFQRHAKGIHEKAKRMLKAFKPVEDVLELAEKYPQVRDALNQMIINHTTENERRGILRELYAKRSARTRKEINRILKFY